MQSLLDPSAPLPSTARVGAARCTGLRPPYDHGLFGLGRAPLPRAEGCR
jgi:hypothetical protein